MKLKNENISTNILKSLKESSVLKETYVAIKRELIPNLSRQEFEQLVNEFNQTAENDYSKVKLVDYNGVIANADDVTMEEFRDFVEQKTQFDISEFITEN